MVNRIYNLADATHLADYATYLGATVDESSFAYLSTKEPEKYRAYLEWALNDITGNFVCMINETMFLYTGI